MLINNGFNEDKIQSPLGYIWSIFKTKTIAVVAMWLIIVLIIVSLFAPWFVPHSPLAQNPESMLLPPYWVEGGDINHILGTDDLGRDSLSRLFHGLQLTLGGALLITLLVGIIGMLIGAAAALTKGVKASVLHHLLDALLAIPTLLSALILITIFGPSYTNCLIAISLSLLPQFIRSSFLAIEQELSKQYIVAIQLDGATKTRLFRYGILPNILEPTITIINRLFTMAIIEIATLGFLGFGAQLPQTELGSIIASSMELIYLSPWLVTFPGIAIFTVIIIVNVLSEGLRHAVLEGEE
ncbi:MULTISPECIES: ABC transporter permease subunit [Psychromonas]|uniref:ABC transporter permease subunit n=1 Tax=Psychromonas TaxID=67572 RepID=UPI0004273060|nr:MULTISPECIES: ABC transporter permease subunit [Psychromonas]MBB1273771.1 ABC transporter permease subunit [Psychromonas sp. SR45-3]